MEFDDWVEKKENEEMDESRESEYGFWSEQRHRTSGERRECIQELVEGANPTLGHIILARLMSEDYVPLTLTPNFDDPLYQFMEVRPHLVNHGAVTPWFKLMHDRPAIVKLHGDYLYDNLRNTDPETSTLSPGREEALRRTVTEYGLVVVGYGGADDSIMDPLIETELSEYGVYWCSRNPDDIDGKPAELLRTDDAYLVEIDGFVSMMTQFEEHIDDVGLPTREELVERADQFNEIVEESMESAADEEAEYVEKQQLYEAGREAYNDGGFEEVIELMNEVIDFDSEAATAYNNRGNAKRDLGEYEAAIEDYDRAIDLDPETSLPVRNRAEARKSTGNSATRSSQPLGVSTNSIPGPKRPTSTPTNATESRN
ncbi:hypothetical protein BRC81_13515 [Halobacteriales archaeon QS_1_68_20]|nr:MAG: hypothetical protein BRC81_13515 [Halobacteriales archaeon QS_1_68_20]